MLALQQSTLMCSFYMRSCCNAWRYLGDSHSDCSSGHVLGAALPSTLQDSKSHDMAHCVPGMLHVLSGCRAAGGAGWPCLEPTHILCLGQPRVRQQQVLGPLAQKPS